MKDQLEENINKDGRLSKSSRMFLVLLGPVLLCLSAVVLILVPPLVLFSPFWILGLIIFSLIQIFAWVFGLAWYKNGGIKTFQNSSFIKKLQTKKWYATNNFFGFLTAFGAAIAILPYILIILAISFIAVVGTIMEGALS